MAEKVKYVELKNPDVLAVQYSNSPFSQKEIELLTARAEKYALVRDGDRLFIYGEGGDET